MGSEGKCGTLPGPERLLRGSTDKGTVGCLAEPRVIRWPAAPTLISLRIPCLRLRLGQLARARVRDAVHRLLASGHDRPALLLDGCYGTPIAPSRVSRSPASGGASSWSRIAASISGWGVIRKPSKPFAMISLQRR